eukprot:CAMPEP_0181446692 /NCGR_PEP_ID=MMETSP1110-20121109/26239_1 /TAXON_ID=174948 /ORGANISM="Symbiodinium sp., Strain CCMP421" /LENGTH=361 /DNA_ID=CAMNT_0023570785 /DNA_START=63 /DNA_END=1148 /DNA_ORIENTATION=-
MSTVAMARQLRRKSLGDSPTALPDVTRSMPVQRLRVPSKGATQRSPSNGSRSPSKGSVRSFSNSSAASSRRWSKVKDLEFERETTPEEEPVTKQRSLPDIKTPALVLSRQLNLDFHEVKMMLEELQKEHEKIGYKGIDLETFRGCLLRVVGIPEIGTDLLQDCYTRCGAANGPMNPRHFMEWYRDHIFALSHKSYTSIEDRKSDDLTLALAKKHHCSCLDLDKVKLQYDSYDLDKSGVIEYGEFELMMLKLLHVNNKSDLPQNRIQRFWQELDKDRSGSVDFSEFTEWYLKYFNLAQEHGPIEAFYASFGPGMRASTLEAMTKADSCKLDVPGAKFLPKEKEDDLLPKSPKIQFHRRTTIG